MFYKKHKKLVFLTVLLLILSAAGLIGYLVAKNEPRVVKQEKVLQDVPVGADEAKIAAGATVDWEYEYKMCSHHIYLHCEVEEHMVGLTFSQLQEQYPDIRIVSFDTDALVLKMSFDCYCPDHYILKRFRDELAIFRTILGSDEQEIYKEIPLRFEEINEEEKEVLETGKLFNSLEEVEEYLENLDT